MRKKILIFIDHDVMTRHFIASGVFKDLELKYNVIYVFNEDKSRFNLSNNKIISDNISQDRIRYTQVPRRRTGIWYLLL